MIAVYNLFCLTEFNNMLWTTYYIGYSYLSIFGAVTLVNISFVVLKNFKGLVVKNKKSKEKKKYMARCEELIKLQGEGG